VDGLQDDAALLEAIRAGDESAFLSLVRRYQAPMLRVARAYVSSAALAEEVVQDAWIGILKGLEGFEGRASLRSWMFRIVANCAQHRGGLERRTVPLSALGDEEDEGGPSVAPERFLDDGHPRWPGHWQSAPEPWAEEKLLTAEAAAAARRAIDELPDRQRQVITLRDVEGLDAGEVCELLAVSEANQRVLLHRARSRVRAALEQHFGAGAAA
jgi:RNA polymerase sigma-70 factor (ECF subfamily)